MEVADGGRGVERWWWLAEEEEMKDGGGGRRRRGGPAGSGARCRGERRRERERERERMGTGDESGGTVRQEGPSRTSGFRTSLLKLPCLIIFFGSNIF